MRLFLVAVPSYARANELVRMLEEDRGNDRAVADDLALVHRRGDGRVRVEQIRDLYLGRGVAEGATLTMLLGLVAAPLISSSALGSGASALIAIARENGMTFSMMSAVSACIERTGAVVCVLGEERCRSFVEQRLDRRTDRLDWLAIPPGVAELARRMAREDWSA